MRTILGLEASTEVAERQASSRVEAMVRPRLDTGAGCAEHLCLRTGATTLVHFYCHNCHTLNVEFEQ